MWDRDKVGALAVAHSGLTWVTAITLPTAKWLLLSLCGKQSTKNSKARKHPAIASCAKGVETSLVDIA